jgi:hypothetical protein
MENQNFRIKQYLITTLITMIPLSIGELLRAELVVIPRMKAFFDDILVYGEMNTAMMALSSLLVVLLSLVLVFTFWLSAKAFGNNAKAIMISATLILISSIAIYWIVNIAIGLGDWGTAFIVLPLAWIEFVIGTWGASRLYALGRWAD